jgi:RNA-binding protein 7
MQQFNMDEESRTLWCGNLSEKVTEELLYELFLQAAPLQRVRIPTDKTGRKSNYAFITVKHAISVEYVVQLLDGTSLYDRRISIKPRNSSANAQRGMPQPNAVNINDLLLLGQLLQPPLNHGTPTTHHYQHNFHNDRSHNRPYHRQDSRNAGRQSWGADKGGYSNKRNRRRYY